MCSRYFSQVNELNFGVHTNTNVYYTNLYIDYTVWVMNEFQYEELRYQQAYVYHEILSLFSR